MERSVTERSVTERSVTERSVTERHVTHSWRYPAALLLAAALLAPSAARAQVSALLTSQSQATAAPGDTVTFYGALANTSTADNYTLTGGTITGFAPDPSMGGGAVFLSGIGYPTDPDPAATLFAVGSGSSTYPAPPAPGADLFTVGVDPTAPAGVYTGTFEVDGYDSTADPADAGGPGPLTTVDFTLTVAPAPEPSGLAAGAVACGLLLALAARRRAARPA